MQHKFACLIELRSIWESLCTDSFVHVVKHLLEIDAIGSYKNVIISGIFQQIYDEGDSNDDLFFAHLLSVSQNKQELQSKPAMNEMKLNENDKFEKLPDGLLCNIASYFPAKDIFSRWNHVNRKFLQIGLKPQSIKHFEFMFVDSDEIPKYRPNFKFNLALSRLESLEVDSWANDIFGKLSIKRVRSLTVGMYLQ